MFELVYGKSLVLAHNFARNEVQRDMLQELTEHFITSGFNLTELLVATVSQDFFATPIDQEPTWDALFDPWGQDDLDPSERINDVADIVHRLPARTLMRGLYTALEWVEPAEFSIYHLTEDAILQREIGVYLKPNSRGFRGTSFQSALAWDAAFGTCSPRLGKSNCPLIEIMQSPQGRLSQCEICGNMDAVCGWDERCCDVDWDTLCAPHQDFCLSFPPSISLATYPPEAASKETPDFIERVVSEIAQSAVPVSMEDAVIAIKDRLLAHPGISDDEERALLAAVVGTPMDTDIRKDDALEARLRRACAVFAATPDFKLAGLTAPAQLTADNDGRNHVRTG